MNTAYDHLAPALLEAHNDLAVHALAYRQTLVGIQELASAALRDTDYGLVDPSLPDRLASSVQRFETSIHAGVASARSRYFDLLLEAGLSEREAAIQVNADQATSLRSGK